MEEIALDLGFEEEMRLRNVGMGTVTCQGRLQEKVIMWKVKEM